MSSEPELTKLFSALEVTGPVSFAWYGRPERAVSTDYERSLPPTVLREQLVLAVQGCLYLNAYCMGQPTPIEGTPRDAALLSSKLKFVTAMSEANLGTGCAQSGWLVEQFDGETAVISRRGLRMRARLTGATGASRAPTAVGDEASVTIPKELPNYSPGYHFVVSNAQYLPIDLDRSLRIYWNVGPVEATELVRLLTKRLNDALVPFRLKILSDPSYFSWRCDSMVLYILAQDYARIVGVLEEIYGGVSTALSDPTPLFTKRLAPGLGLAEGPSGGESFGMTMCSIVANAVVTAHERHATSIEDRLAIIHSSFEENGISLATPYLAAGSADDPYSFNSGDLLLPATQLLPAAGPDLQERYQYLQAAWDIGRSICHRAHWYEDMCNWMGLEPTHPSENGAGSGRVAYRALSPFVYSGTAGLAIFLAELCVECDDDLCRRTALGAIRQALLACDSLRGGALYDGPLGVGLAAAHVGGLLGDEELIAQAAHFSSQWTDDFSGSNEHDLIAGTAGAIVALLCMAELLSDGSRIALAYRLGEQLVAGATRQSHGQAWKSRLVPERRPLTGLSHGTAGIALALLHLFEVTGDRQFRDAAEDAFRYEQACYVTRARNWPDFRSTDASSGVDGMRVPCATAWCHGAPGIALSRMRAFSLLGASEYREQALIALETTKWWTERALALKPVDFSLCHGLAGNAAILHYGATVFDERFGEGHAVAVQVGRFGMQHYGPASDPWPFDRPFVGSPSLMVGEGGVGHFYLSTLYQGRLPSALLWQPGLRYAGLRRP